MPALRMHAYVVIPPDRIDTLRPRPTPGAVYQITAMLTRSVKLTPLAGGRPFSINPGHLDLATPQQIEVAQRAAQTAPPRVRTGTVVRFKNPTPNLIRQMARVDLTPTAPLVATKEHVDGSVDLAVLGGRDDGYGWRKVPARALAIVDMDWLTVP